MAHKEIGKVATAVFAAGVIVFSGLQFTSMKARADATNKNGEDTDEALAAIGMQIAPSFIKITTQDRTLVGLGSFIVNGQADCNGCHGSDPANEYVAANNPYLLGFTPPRQYNQATYLNGGQDFGPVGGGIVNGVHGPGPDIISRNLTPDFTGNPEGGNQLHTFIQIIRTGVDMDNVHPNCGGNVKDNCYFPPTNGALLQVMPWPLHQNMTDHQLTAIWTYLSTVPCNAHNDALGNQYPWLKNTCAP